MLSLLSGDFLKQCRILVLLVTWPNLAACLIVVLFMFSVPTQWLVHISYLIPKLCVSLNFGITVINSSSSDLFTVSEFKKDFEFNSFYCQCSHLRILPHICFIKQDLGAFVFHECTVLLNYQSCWMIEIKDLFFQVSYYKCCLKLSIILGKKVSKCVCVITFNN